MRGERLPFGLPEDEWSQSQGNIEGSTGRCASPFEIPTEPRSNSPCRIADRPWQEFGRFLLSCFSFPPVFPSPPVWPPHSRLFWPRQARPISLPASPSEGVL